MRAALDLRRGGHATHLGCLLRRAYPTGPNLPTTTLSAVTRHASSSNNKGAITTTTAELRAALLTLRLSEDCSDAEVKRAFQAFAILHHPDTNNAAAAAAPSSSTASTPMSAEARAAMMHRGTEAYHLLREIPYETRQRILKESNAHSNRSSGTGSGRFRGPFGDFHFTAEEYAKAQKIYQGDRNRRRQQQQQQRRRGGMHSNEEEDEFFDLSTEEGRRRAARFDEVKARIAEMRLRGRREDLPPWRVYDDAEGSNSSRSGGGGGGGGGSSTASFNTGATYSSASPGGSSAKRTSGSTAAASRGGAGNDPRKSHRFGLHFLHTTAANFRNVRDLYSSRPGFAGMDGSSYGNPGSAARVAPELSANPHLREYILMKHRAQEKAVVDRAVRRPLLLFLLLVSMMVGVLTALRVVKSCSAGMRKDEELRQ